ncbi:hypothetical protein [uncultured Roseobacter sp.]|uniref:hypothetical protein n=1 Tax=uncultured Roseobacter sp. TaxID=114847 RepID=UPI0026084980|nr:hypothetical protein [uncultured Roseobacter sp.]
MVTTYDYRMVLGPHSPVPMPLQRLLAANRTLLHDVGTEFPKVQMHRKTMANTLGLLTDGMPDQTAHENYLKMVLEHKDSGCIVYSYGAFLSSRKNALRAGVLYPSLEKKIAPLRRLTDGQRVTVFLCLQHFTQFIELELKRSPHLRHLVDSYPHSLDFSWVHFVCRMRAAWPEALFVILDAENLAVNWAATVALITGHPDTHTFKNIEEFPVSCLAENGRASYLQALKASPPQTVPEWTAITSRFFSEYGSHVPIIRKVIASPWSSNQIEHSKQKYEADLVNLRALDNVIMSSDVEWAEQ